MKLVQVLLILAFSVSLPLAAFAGIPGTYTINTKKLLETATSHINKRKIKPKLKARALKFATTMITSMKMKLTFHKDGKYSSQASMKFMGVAKKSQSTGTWTRKGKLLIINSVTKRKKRTSKATIHCSFGPKSLECHQPNKKIKQIMYFTRVK